MIQPSTRLQLHEIQAIRPECTHYTAQVYISGSPRRIKLATLMVNIGNLILRRSPILQIYCTHYCSCSSSPSFCCYFSCCFYNCACSLMNGSTAAARSYIELLLLNVWSAPSSITSWWFCTAAAAAHEARRVQKAYRHKSDLHLAVCRLSHTQQNLRS